MERYENFMKDNDLFFDDDKPKKEVDSKICTLCGIFVYSKDYTCHVAQCSDERKEKICINCGKSVSLNSFILHEAQCLKIEKKDSSISTKFNLLSTSSKENSLGYDKLESVKKNSFMILKHDSEDINISRDPLDENNFFIIDNRTTDQKNRDLNSNREINNPYKESELFDLLKKVELRQVRKQEEVQPSKNCRYCNQYFPTVVYLELHEKACGDGNNDLSIENEFSNEYSPRNQTYNRNQSISNINFEDPNLGYEDLLRLDDKITHPLSKLCLSMLNEETITSIQISKLEDEYRKCLICFEDFENGQKIVRLPCLHIFHTHDIFKWFETNKTCPVCRCELEEILK
jgi:hypothetical protein